MSGSIIVCKIGGSIIDGVNPSIVDDMKSSTRAGAKVVLVHGGGDQVTSVAEKMGKKQEFITSPEGIKSRYTDKETAEIFTMVMSGLLAKQIVQTLEKNGIQSVSLTGIDGMLLKAQRKKKLIVVDDRGRKVVIEGGFTGKINGINSSLLELFLSNNLVPVISPVAAGEEFELLNVDGDRACSHVAGALNAEAAIFLTDTEGLILDNVVVSKMSTEEARKALPEDWIRNGSEGHRGRGGGRDGGEKVCHRVRIEGKSFAKGDRRDWDGDFKLNEEDAHLIPLYQKFPIEVVRGDGALVYDEKGQEFIDLSGGYGVAIVGHANKRVADAITAQAHKLITCHGSFYNDSRQKYYRFFQNICLLV